METVTLEERFGPLGSGNGGYVGGLLAGVLCGAAEVTLRAPVPLGRPLGVEMGDEGGARLLDGERPVAEGRPLPDFALDVPAPVSAEEARQASRDYRGPLGSPFSRCFVCGRDREDALGVFAGPVAGRELVASPWTPPAWADGGEGATRPEIVWSALDCPTFFATYLETPDPLPAAMLGRLAGRVEGPVRVGEEHVVIAWPLGAEGRKRCAGSAVLGPDGTVLARAEALMIEPRPES